jgi:hypothetical protein
VDRATAERILCRVREEKSADFPGGTELPAIDAFRDSLTESAAAQAKNQAWRDVGRAGLAGVGIGVGGAGLISLMGLLQSRRNPVALRPSPPLEIHYPAGGVRERERDKDAVDADAPLDWAANKLDDIAPSVWNWARGDAASKAKNIPWRNAAMIAAGTAGVGLGWHATKGLTNKIREDEGESDVEAARQNFQAALRRQWPEAKVASESPDTLGASLDALYDQHVKNAAPGDFADTAGGLVNTYYGPYAATTGLAGLFAGYSAGRKSSTRSILEKAMARRERERAERTPPELFAVPTRSEGE